MDRLTEAISTLASARSAERISVASVCRLASVSRNTLYRYYSDILESIRHLRARRGTERIRSLENTLRSVRRDLATLREQLAKMASLADHYHALTQELRAQLARRDRELAELRRRARPGLIGAPAAQS